MMLFPEDPVFPEAEARKLFAPIEGRLQRCVLNGFARVKALGDSDPILAGALDYKGTRPALVNSVIVELVQREFAEDSPNLRIVTLHQFVELQVDGVIDLRFKHVDKAGRTSNYPTETSRRCKNQLPLFGEDEELTVARMTLGWRWNLTATEIEDISVIYAKGDDPLWTFSILEERDDQAVLTTRESRPDTGAAVYQSKKKAQDTQRGA